MLLAYSSVPGVEVEHLRHRVGGLGARGDVVGPKLSLIRAGRVVVAQAEEPGDDLEAGSGGRSELGRAELRADVARSRREPERLDERAVQLGHRHGAVGVLDDLRLVGDAREDLAERAASQRCVLA